MLRTELIRIYFGVGGGKCSGCGTELNPENESIENGGTCKECDSDDDNEDD